MLYTQASYNMCYYPAVPTIFCLGRGELLLRNTDLTPILGITLLEESN